MEIVVTLTGGVEVPVESLHEASVRVREEIKALAVGSNAWCEKAGRVKVNGVTVAHISYNGRAWLGAKRWKVSPEIGEAEFKAIVARRLKAEGVLT